MSSPLANPLPPLTGDRFAAQLRGFGPLGVVAMLVILGANFVAAPLSAVLVLVWVWRSETPWRDIGYVPPPSWIRTITGGVVFGSALKLVLKAIMMPLLGAPPINQPYHHLVGNAAAIPITVLALTVGAGWGEETVYRGYLFERLGRLLGSGVGAKTAVVLFTTTLFALAHYPEQGLAGAEQATITGAVFGTIFAVTGRLVWVMIAHAAFDLTAYAIIYWNLEADVAHIFFQ